MYDRIMKTRAPMHDMSVMFQNTQSRTYNRATCNLWDQGGKGEYTICDEIQRWSAGIHHSVIGPVALQLINICPSPFESFLSGRQRNSCPQKEGDPWGALTPNVMSEKGNRKREIGRSPSSAGTVAWAKSRDPAH